MSNRPPYIFISYSHEDKDYAHRLAERLEQKGFSVWIDDRIDYGTQWPAVIEEHLDSSSAPIVIMTPRSHQSKWVQNELSRAQRKGKPIFPILLEGDEPWLSVEATQYVDVRGGRLPLPDFYERLAQVIPRRTTEGPTAAIKDPEAAQVVARVAYTTPDKASSPSPSIAQRAKSSLLKFERVRPEMSLWLAWVLFSTAGGAVVGLLGGVLVLGVVRAVGVSAVGTIISSVVYGTVSGVVVGVFQWLVLRRRIPSAGWWVLATTAGGAVGAAAGAAVGSAVVGTVGVVVASAVVGVVVGVFQWLVLRQRIPSAGWWVLATTVGRAVGGAVGVALGAGPVGGMVTAAITGGALVWLLGRTDAEV